MGVEMVLQRQEWSVQASPASAEVGDNGMH